MRPTDKVLVEKALDIYSKGKVSREEILKSVNPVVVYLPDMNCVGLNLKEGVLGGDTTICFDKRGNQVLFYVSGD